MIALVIALTVGFVVFCLIWGSKPAAYTPGGVDEINIPPVINNTIINNTIVEVKPDTMLNPSLEQTINDGVDRVINHMPPFGGFGITKFDIL